MPQATARCLFSHKTDLYWILFAENYSLSENFKSLLNILDEVIDLQRLISKTYASSMALYECLDGNRDFAARVGDKVLADAAEVICDYSREADSVMSEIHNDLNKLHDYHNYEL